MFVYMHEISRDVPVLIMRRDGNGGEGAELHLFLDESARSPSVVDIDIIATLTNANPLLGLWLHRFVVRGREKHLSRSCCE
jgi:hypothetical protein